MTPAQVFFSWEGFFDGADLPIVGSGPFIATRTIGDDLASGEQLTLVKNPDYHWAADRSLDVRFDRIEMKFFDDDYAMAVALESGNIDVAQFPPSEYASLKDRVLMFDGPKCTQYWTDVVICMSELGSNPSRLDPVIRRAMAMATNKSSVVEDFYHGFADEGSTLIPKVNEMWHYEPTEEETYDFDIDAANDLLEDAGYRYTVSSPTVRVCTADSYAVQKGLVAEGTLLSYEMLVRQEAPEERHIALYLQEEWSNIGIDIQYIIMTEATLGSILYSYNYDTAIWHWSSDPDPNYMLFCQSEYSYGGWSDNRYMSDEYTENYTESVQALDYSERKTYVDNCQRIHYGDAPYIILACPHQTYAWRTDTLDGWGDWADDPGRSIDAYWGGNPFYFEPLLNDYYAPVTTVELSGTQGENGWYTSDVTVTLDAEVVAFDVTPPSTAILVNGTSGDNGWYVSGVSVSFVAEDASGAVESTMYSLDGAPFAEYVEDIVIDSLGVHVIDYYSIDDSGNAEDEKSRTVKIDSQDPTVTILEDDGAEFNSSEVMIEFECDDEVSGVDFCACSLDGGEWMACEPPRIYLHEVENGEHTLVVAVFDRAGNAATDSLVFVVDAPTIVAPRSVDYLWNDMFAHPFGSWYDGRSETYGWEHVLTDEYPYLLLYEGPALGDYQIKSFMRLNITGRNMTELNMLSNPEFLPIFSETDRGGTAVLDWHMNYLTYEEALEKLPPIMMVWYDGWYFAWNGTVLLDRPAAMAVLDITNSQFDGFDSWWLANGGDVALDWEEWLMYEAGPERLTIWNMYGWDLQFLFFDLQAEKVGADHVQLTFDTVSWGMEALMTKWMHEAFMPTEWWFEDVDFHAVIGPQMADIDFDAAVAYSVVAQESILDGTPCWTWQAMLQDYLPSSLPYPISDFDPYVDLEYLNRRPGSDWYGESMTYDYTPGSWSLSENETLTLERPEGEQLFVVHDETGTGEGLIDNTVNLTAEMTARYAMPMPFDDPNVVSIDNEARRITFTGPFEMSPWSQEQAEHEWLMDEWVRLDLLPFGIPYIEFTADIESGPLEMQMDGPASPLLLELATAFTVTIVNATTQEVYADYAGTVTFMSSDPGAMLPSDYTFVPGVDAGSHEFAVTFTSTAGIDDPHWLSVRDVDKPYVYAVADDIVVMVSLSARSMDLGAYLLAAAPPTIDSTMYRIDIGAWMTYDSPFVISDEGVHTVDYCSVDSDGTMEETKRVTVKIDKTLPELTFVTTNGTVFENGSADIEWECSDDVSGVDLVEYCVDGGSYVQCASESYVNLCNISDGTHVLSVRVYDHAGHCSEADIVFGVTTVEQDDKDPDDLIGPLSALEVAAVAGAIAACALGAAFFLMRRRGRPPEGDVGGQRPSD